MEQNVRYYSKRCKGRQGCTCSSVSFWPWRSARWCHGWPCKGQPLRTWAQAVGLVICLGLCLAATNGLAGEVSASPASPLAGTAWLASQLSAAQLRVVDLRAAGDYQKGHIPQAVHLDAGALVEAQPVEQGRRFALAALAERMGRLGIGDTTEVVAYDDQGGLNAARLWWLLTSAGHSSVRVLDGGWGKWQQEKRPVTTEVMQPAPATFTVRQVAGFFATKEDVKQAVGVPAATLVDARSGLEYRGLTRYAARGGHIPGAVHLEWKHSLQKDGTFLPPEALSTLVQQAGVSPDRRIITYCQIGPRATHLAFVLAMLGYPNVAVYDGSWAEWGNDPQSPIE